MSAFPDELCAQNTVSVPVVFTTESLRQCAACCYEAYRAHLADKYGAQLKPWASIDGVDRLGWVIAARLALRRNGGMMDYDVPPSQEMKLTD